MSSRRPSNWGRRARRCSQLAEIRFLLRTSDKRLRACPALTRRKGSSHQNPLRAAPGACRVEGPQAKATVSSPRRLSPSGIRVGARTDTDPWPVQAWTTTAFGGEGPRQSLEGRGPKCTTSKRPEIHIKEWTAGVASTHPRMVMCTLGTAIYPLAGQPPQACPRCGKPGCSHTCAFLCPPLHPALAPRAHLRSLSHSTFRGRQQPGLSAITGVLARLEPPPGSLQQNPAPVAGALLPGGGTSSAPGTPQNHRGPAAVMDVWGWLGRVPDEA